MGNEPTIIGDWLDVEIKSIFNFISGRSPGLLVINEPGIDIMREL